jgi:hypothetical protein
MYILILINNPGNSIKIAEHLFYDGNLPQILIKLKLGQPKKEIM